MAQFFGVTVPGFATLIISVMFFSGIQLIFLGVIGEYVGRIFAEVKRRPLYLVAEEIDRDSDVPMGMPEDASATRRGRAHAAR